MNVPRSAAKGLRVAGAAEDFIRSTGSGSVEALVEANCGDSDEGGRASAPTTTALAITPATTVPARATGCQVWPRAGAASWS